MQYIKHYLDYALIGLVLVGEGFAYGATSSNGRLLYVFHLILFMPLLGRYILYFLEEAERRKISIPEERVRDRANFDLVVKSKVINDESQKRLSHYSALFLHLKNLATTRDEEEQIKLFLNILQDPKLHLLFHFLTVGNLQKVSRHQQHYHLYKHNQIVIF